MHGQTQLFHYVLCIAPDDPELDVRPRTIYRALDDPDATEHGWLRIVDESGEDYLYPERLFIPIDVPHAAQEAFAISA